jgi:hypothetical protein
MNASLKCHCGQRILARDVVQRIRVIRRFGSPMMYIRYRCPRCKQIGEMYIRHEQWRAWVLANSEPEVTPEEQTRFESMGPITEDEVARVKATTPRLEDLKAREDG